MSELEIRAVAALSADALTSTVLAGLADEIFAAVEAADAAAAKARQAAYDPALSPDADKARAEMERAALAAERLRALYPRLLDRRDAIEHRERSAIWNEQADEVEAQRDALADELRQVLPELTGRLVNLFHRIKNVDDEVGRINRQVPDGETRRLATTEVTARADLENPRGSAIKETIMPDFGDPRKILWPPQQPTIGEIVAASQLTQPIGTYARADQWWRDAEGRKAQRREEAERVAAYYAEQERRRKQRENEEALQHAEAPRQHSLRSY